MPIKRVNPRLAKVHRAYDIYELATILRVHKNTVRSWIKQGLPTVDGSRPILILGSVFQEWWSKRRRAAKRPLQPGQFYCLKCRQPNTPALGMVEYSATNGTTGNLKAMCETCGTLMHRRAKLADLANKMPNLDVQITQAASSISERPEPCLNTDNSIGA